MRINVAAFGGRTHLGLLDTDVAGSPWEEVLLVCLPRHFDLTELDDQWQRLDPTLTANVQATFLRIHPGDEAECRPRAGQMAPGLEVLRRRARVPIHLVTWSEGAHRIELASVSDEPLALTYDLEVDLLGQLGRAEMTTYAADPRTRLPENSRFHYIGPNGQHYRSFLRVQSVLQLPDQLDSAAFWLLPFVDQDSVVLLDSSTISVVGLHLGQYLRETGLAETRSVQFVLPMRGYDDEVAELVLRRVESALADAADRKHALVLVSVVGTGGLALRGRALAERLHFDRVTSVGIYGTGDGEKALAEGQLDAIVALVEDDLGRIDEDACELCSPTRRGESPALHIGRDNYQVQVSYPIAAELSGNALLPAIDAIKMYAGSKAFTVHRDEPMLGLSRRPRHHGIYVDVGLLLDDETFRDRLMAKSRDLRPHVAAILTPEHDAAIRIGRDVGDEIGLPVISRNAERFDTLSAAERGLLEGGRILIVDDAIITGSRLRGYRRALLTHELAPTDVHVLTGFCRPTSRKKRQAIANIVHQFGEAESTLHPVEDLLLPDMDERQCPWCWERGLLHDYGRRGEEIPAEVMARADVLDRNGLVEQLFWGWQDDVLPLGPGSVLGPTSLTQAQIFIMLASGIQVLRSEGKLDEEFTPPVSKVLAPEFWVDGRFYAEPITASILRAANPHDLTAPVAGREFTDSIQRLWDDSLSKNLRGELLLATIAEKLPVVAGTLAAITDPQIDSALTEFFVSHIPVPDAES